MYVTLYLLKCFFTFLNYGPINVFRADQIVPDDYSTGVCTYSAPVSHPPLLAGSYGKICSGTETTEECSTDKRSKGFCNNPTSTPHKGQWNISHFVLCNYSKFEYFTLAQLEFILILDPITFRLATHLIADSSCYLFC